VFRSSILPCDTHWPNTANRRSLARPPSLDQHMPEGGFPIRKSPDQSSFATPRSLSQRTTSFIASQCQGIHRMPLRRLIALIINALHPPPPKETAGDHTTDKTILLRIHPMPARCTPRDPAPSPPRRDGRNPAHNRMNVLFTMSNNPQPEHDRATPAPRHRRRTQIGQTTPRRTQPANPNGRQTRMVEPDGIEPTTSCLQSTRSPS
jgi:hypothetical protein